MYCDNLLHVKLEAVSLILNSGLVSKIYMEEKKITSKK